MDLFVMHGYFMSLSHLFPVKNQQSKYFIEQSSDFCSWHKSDEDCVENLYYRKNRQPKVQTDCASKIRQKSAQFTRKGLLDYELRSTVTFCRSLHTFSIRTFVLKTICNTEYPFPQTKSFSIHLFL